MLGQRTLGQMDLWSEPVLQTLKFFLNREVVLKYFNKNIKFKTFI